MSVLQELLSVELANERFVHLAAGEVEAVEVAIVREAGGFELISGRPLGVLFISALTTAQWSRLRRIRYCCSLDCASAGFGRRARIIVARALGRVDSWDSLLGANQIQGCFWEAVLGVMDRLVLSEAAWERMAPLIMGRPDVRV